MEKIPVLDQGYVHVIEMYGSDENIIEAARMSTHKGFQGWGTPEEPGDEKLLKFLYENHHDTPFEMAGAIFEIKAPIFVFREWHRHRTQSYNEMSGRYIKLPDEDFFPDAANAVKRSQAASTNKQAGTTGAVLDLNTALADIERMHMHAEATNELYQMLLDHGWPKELARIRLPVARYSCMRANANLRNWLHFLSLRESSKAQEEIRAYANVVGSILKGLFPRTLNLHYFTERK